MEPVHAARFDSSERNSSSGCLEGTREELLTQIMSWVDDQDAPRFCWLSGLAGTGKTTIAHSVCERLSLKKCLGASFFFSRYRNDRSTALLAIPTIVYQLALARPALLDSVCQALETTPDVAHRKIDVQVKILLSQALPALPGVW